MKRLALVLLLLVPSSSRARGVLIYDPDPASAAGDVIEQPANQMALVQMVLEQYPYARFEVAPTALVKTAWCQSGIFGFHPTYADTFGYVVHVSWKGKVAGGNANYRADSMLAGGATKAPLVPQVFLIPNYGSVAGQHTTTAACTTCFTAIKSAGGNIGHEAESAIWTPGTTRTFFGTNVLGYPSGGAACTGGVRYLTSVYPCQTLPYEQAYGVSTNAWMDSLTADAYSTTPDPSYSGTPYATSVWSRLFSNVAGAKEATFVYGLSAGGAPDSGGTNVDRYNENMDVPSLLIALAHTDSLTGGAVIGASPPVAIGIVVRGGGRRSGRANPGGVFEPDSAAFKATCDSLASLGVPLTVAVEPDSFTAQEAAWWRRAGKVQLALETRTAADPFEQGWAMIAKGDGSGAGKDSSFDAKLTAAFASLKANAHGLPVSRFICPPNDKWIAPLNAAKRDSFIYVLAQHGVTGVLANGQNPYGGREPGWLVTSLSGARIPRPGHCGNDVAGSARIWGTFRDSIPPVGSVPPVDATFFDYAPFWQNYQRAVFGAFCPAIWNNSTGQIGKQRYPNRYGAFGTTDITNGRWGVWYSKDDYVYGLGSGGRIVATTMQQLAGSASAPTRPAWWTLKSLVNMAKTVNSYGRPGHPFLAFVSPDRVKP